MSLILPLSNTRKEFDLQVPANNEGLWIKGKEFTRAFGNDAYYLVQVRNDWIERDGRQVNLLKEQKLVIPPEGMVCFTKAVAESEISKPEPYVHSLLAVYTIRQIADRFVIVEPPKNL